MTDELDELLAEQIAYYRARAAEYFAGVLDEPGGDELEGGVGELKLSGDVLELACGPGSWTGRLLRDADSVTAVDSSPEMLAIARERIGDDPRVRLIEADLFDWQPDRRYDVCFFGFWLSHVPLERFEAFWATVDAALAPDGVVAFVDDAYRTADELIEGEDSSVVLRRLLDGTEYRAVKVPHTPESLEQRIRSLGWDVRVHATRGPFFWGEGRRA